VQRKALTSLIYGLAALGSSLFWITRRQDGTWPAGLLYWLLLFSPPLLFVFAYPRFLFAAGTSDECRERSAVIFHGLGAVVMTILFVDLGAAFWRNPLRDADPMLLLVVPLVAVPVFLTAAVSLLIRNRSTLATFASSLLWPYWLLLALTFCGRFFEEPIFRAAFAFLCFVVSLLFAFAAGAVIRRPIIAHCSALAGLVCTPWVYWTTLQDTPLGNIWTLFNVPDRELLMYNMLFAKLTILSLGLMVVGIATAAIRLLPTAWKLRGLPLCERTWPSFGAAFIFIALWFSQSVMPYRIAGAVDYARWPILQILHIEKRGLQFHETCISVWGYRNDPESITFSGNDRRLFQYRFQQNEASGELPEPLKNRISSLILSSQASTRTSDEVQPLRKWNVDGWYFTGQGIGLKAYTTENGVTPPQEIVDLFHDIDKLPRLRESASNRRDVCLGFCYDPLSGLGLLNANHRCRYDSSRHDYVCR